MKLWYYVKNTVVTSFKQLPTLVIGLLLLPLLMSIFMGFSMSSVFTSEVSKLNIPVYVNNQDISEIGQSLNQMIAVLDEQEVLKQESELSEADFEIIIPQTYGKEVLSGKVTQPIRIIPHGTTSVRRQLIVETLFKQLTQSYAEIGYYQKMGHDLADIQTLIQRIGTQMQHVTYQTSIHQGEGYITSKQYYSLLYIGFIMVVVLTSNIVSVTKPDLGGLFKRIKSLPFTPVERVLYSVVSSFITYMAIVMFYVAIWKVLDGQTFIGNPLDYIGVVSLMLLVILSISELMSLFMTERLSQILSGIVSILWVFLSGVFPARDFEESGFAIIAHNPIKALFSDPLFTILGDGNVFEHWVAFLVMIVIIIGCLSSAIFVVKSREEYA